jgi:TPR repeat protein
MYLLGDGVEKDARQAAQLYRKAAEAGNAYSFFELGNCYSNGSGVDQDNVEAEICYRRGAEAGDFSCQCELADWHIDGRASKPDVGEALKLLEKAESQATGAIEKRKVQLARVGAYQKSGIEQLDRGNKEQAARLLRDALKLADKLDKEYPGRFYTENALSSSFLELARYHEEVRELAEAVKCYQKASDLGEIKATRRLATLYEKGQLVPIDPEKARALRSKADSFKMVRFTVPGEMKLNGRKLPIPIFVRDDYTGDDPLESQERWYKDEGIALPTGMKEAFAKLLKIARENNVSYTEVCKYAFAKEGIKPAPAVKDP